MRSVNKVILIGNLTRNPEMRQTPSGQSVVTFGIATNREWITKDGRKQNSAEFHDLVAWAKLADICNQYLSKGKLIYVEGYLKTRSWDASEGTKKFRTEVVIQDMIMLDKRDGTDDSDFYAESSENEEESQDTPSFKSPSPQEKEKNRTETSEEEPAKEEPALTTNQNKVDIDSDLGL